jgi:hypothetical protein
VRPGRRLSARPGGVACWFEALGVARWTPEQVRGDEGGGVVALGPCFRWGAVGVRLRASGWPAGASVVGPAERGGVRVQGHWGWRGGPRNRSGVTRGEVWWPLAPAFAGERSVSALERQVGRPAGGGVGPAERGGVRVQGHWGWRGGPRNKSGVTMAGGRAWSPSALGPCFRGGAVGVRPERPVSPGGEGWGGCGSGAWVPAAPDLRSRWPPCRPAARWILALRFSHNDTKVRGRAFFAGRAFSCPSHPDPFAEPQSSAAQREGYSRGRRRRRSLRACGCVP